jgi:glycosyltransferase involved in cell wall biosynthesis
MLALSNFGKISVNKLLAIARREASAGNWGNAVTLYQKILADHPKNAAAWVQYGHALKEAGNYGSAEAAYRNAVSLRPILADTHLQLGHLLKVQGRTEEAIAAYRQAVTLAPYLRDAQVELTALDQGYRSPPRAPKTGALPQIDAGIRPETLPAVVFDVSDLLSYFTHSRTPTGIQRVQICVLESLLRGLSARASVYMTCFTDRRDFWVGVPSGLFLEIADLALSGGDIEHPVWRDMLGDLNARLDEAPDFEFPPGATLVNVGTSWWLKNYFLMVRLAKAKYGIRYVPFIHDLIPIMTPEHCVKELTQDFINWTIGAFSHADGYLVNSEATGKDLCTVARLLGHPIEMPPVVRLDAQFAIDRGPDLPSTGLDLERFFRGREPFVLFVGTIESRKNHVLAFNVWLDLIKKRGERATPTLICVGNNGWLTEAALSTLNASTLLQRKVKMLSRISDRDLARLYRHCLITIYPSSYEGWGLPVTESLCYGKVVLTTAISSLPEAGGEFAEYFAHQSAADMIEKLERLIDDHRYRQAREAMIRERFKPRGWNAIADDMIRGALASAPTDRSAAQASPLGEVHYLPAVASRYYSLARNRETVIWAGMSNGEMYRLGAGWWGSDDWGTWTKPGAAMLGFTFHGDVGENYILYLGLLGLPELDMRFTVRFSTVAGAERSGWLGARQSRWLILKVPPEVRRAGELQLTVETEGRFDLRDVTDGADPRVVGLGVRGFYLCAESDLLGRLRFMEALQMDGLDELDGRPEDGSRYVPGLE